MNIQKEFVPYEQSLALKELGFDEPCFGYRRENNVFEFFSTPDRDNTNSIFQFYPTAPTFSQAINFLYICSNKQIDIELKGSDTHEERIRKIEKGYKDLRNKKHKV